VNEWDIAQAVLEKRDPRRIKRERRAIRRALIALIEESIGSRRCWWTWPLGHDFGGRGYITTHSTDATNISRCAVCGRPYGWGSFDLYDLFRFAEEKTGLESPSGECDPRLEALGARWRALDE
jgi:hypothetical protein